MPRKYIKSSTEERLHKATATRKRLEKAKLRITQRIFQLADIEQRLINKIVLPPAPNPEVAQ